MAKTSKKQTSTEDLESVVIADPIADPEDIIATPKESAKPKEPAKPKKEKKELTDADVKKKAVKLVVIHLRKKLPHDSFLGSASIFDWIEQFEALLDRPEFETPACYDMRRELNDIIERTVDEELRFKLRDSWFSLGKALDKKVKRQ